MENCRLSPQPPPDEPPITAPFSQSSASETSSYPNGSYGGQHDEHEISKRARFEESAEAPGSAGPAATQQIQVPVVYLYGPSPHKLYFSPAFRFRLSIYRGLSNWDHRLACTTRKCSSDFLPKIPPTSRTFREEAPLRYLLRVQGTEATVAHTSTKSRDGRVSRRRRKLRAQPNKLQRSRFRYRLSIFVVLPICFNFHPLSVSALYRGHSSL